MAGWDDGVLRAFRTEGRRTVADCFTNSGWAMGSVTRES
jgi:hypothetical protein